MRRKVGVSVLAVSVFYSAMDLLGYVRPVLLRMRIHEGLRRTAGIVLASLTFKAVLLFTGILLAFWPVREKQQAQS